MTAFESAFDLLKRFVLGTESDMILEGDDLEGWDEATPQDFYLVDTMGGGNVKAGEFTLMPTNDVESDISMLDEILSGYVDGSDDFLQLQRNIRYIMQGGEALKFNENNYPVIHSSIFRPYSRQRLYQNSVLPTLIDRIGGITSDRAVRSSHADNAHLRMQQMANQDYRLRYENPKPLAGEYTADELFEHLFDSSGLGEPEDDQDEINLGIARNHVDNLRQYGRYDNYEKVLPRDIMRGWGALKPSPRTIPMVHLDELGGIPRHPRFANQRNYRNGRNTLDDYQVRFSRQEMGL